MSVDRRTEVSVACRGLAAKGLGAGVGGHVSIRDDESYWVNRVDRQFAEIGAEDVVRVGIESGEVVEGDSDPSPGVTFHNAIYQARPDVGAIVHTHADWITALAALRRPLRMLNVRSTLFIDTHVVSPDDDLASIAVNLGTCGALLIPFHGAITVGADVGPAAALHVTLEEAAAVDVRLAAVDLAPMTDDEARSTRKIMESADYLGLTWDLIRRLATDGS